jgi:hypothetical protein
MEILAPWLRSKGQYIAANRDQSLPQYVPDHLKLLERLKAEPQLYDRVLVTAFRADNHPIAPAGSADVVISFRNLHNWMDQNELEPSLKAFYLALKPGGVLGIVDHRGRTDQTQAQQTASGYVRQDVAIALIEQAGIKQGRMGADKDKARADPPFRSAKAGAAVAGQMGCGGLIHQPLARLLRPFAGESGHQARQMARQKASHLSAIMPPIPGQSLPGLGQQRFQTGLLIAEPVAQQSILLAQLCGSALELFDTCLQSVLQPLLHFVREPLGLDGGHGNQGLNI